MCIRDRANMEGYTYTWIFNNVLPMTSPPFNTNELSFLVTDDERDTYVSLLLSDNLGCGDTTIRQTINVIDAPDQPSFNSLLDTTGCPGEDIVYAATDLSLTYIWDVVSGDVDIDTSNNTGVLTVNEEESIVNVSSFNGCLKSTIPTSILVGSHGTIADIDTIFGNSLVCNGGDNEYSCLLYTSPSPRDRQKSRMPSSA